MFTVLIFIILFVIIARCLLSAGKTQGRKIGYSEGETSGHARGKTEGYNDGFAACQREHETRKPYREKGRFAKRPVYEPTLELTPPPEPPRDLADVTMTTERGIFPLFTETLITRPSDLPTP